MQSLIVLGSLVSEFNSRRGSKISGRPSPKIRASMGKNYILGILVERAINYIDFV